MPEELLEAIKVPVTIAWGDQDPWEPVELGRELAAFDAVEVQKWTTIKTMRAIDSRKMGG